VAIGVSVGFALVAANGLSTARPAPLAVSLPFVAAFAAFELVLYTAGFILPGGEGAFTASIVGHIFLINALALFGLMTVYNLSVALGILARDGAAPSAGVSSLR
jgi:hypothetical protein